MPTFFVKPENALKRATEFTDVGKHERALEVLADVMRARKHRTFRIKVHEEIMKRFVELCVELRKPALAKEILHQYKNMVLQMNTNALVEVVRLFLQLGEKRLEEAHSKIRTQSTDAPVALDVIDDLDVLQSPESLQLAVQAATESGQTAALVSDGTTPSQPATTAPGQTTAEAPKPEGSTDQAPLNPTTTAERSERTLVTPWLRFLWESYRQCLDLLRNNAKLERLYQDVAQLAFNFCLTYGRKAEFRKLCDTLRLHLGQTQKYQGQNRAPHAIDLSVPESQAMHLETRLAQLDVAIKMELWMEALRAIEDIHGLIALNKKPPKPSLMANYYAKQALVFLKSGSPLYHALSLHRLYQLYREQRKSVSSDELQRLANRALLATLAIPFVHNAPVRPSASGGVGIGVVGPSPGVDPLIEPELAPYEKHKKLAAMLGLTIPPTRSSLIALIYQQDMIKYASTDVAALFTLLESDLRDPVALAQQTRSAVELLKNTTEPPPPSSSSSTAVGTVLLLELAQYMPRLEEVCVQVLLRQMCRLFSSFGLDRFFELFPRLPRFALERLVVDSARTLDLPIRIDHQANCLRFVQNLSVLSSTHNEAGAVADDSQDAVFRTQLAQMYGSVHKSLELLYVSHSASTTPSQAELASASPVAPLAYSEGERASREATLAAAWLAAERAEHVRVLKRKQVIETRKEQLENINKIKERQEQEREQAADRARREAVEAQRRAEERVKEESARVREKQKEEQNAQLAESFRRTLTRQMLANSLRTKLGDTVMHEILDPITDQELSRMHPNELVQRGIALVEKARRESQEKVRNQEKKLDHLVRAKRQHEISLLQKQYDEEVKRERAEWEAAERERLTQARSEFERSVELRGRLTALVSDKATFLEGLLSQTRSNYEQKHAEWKEKYDEARQERLDDRRDQRRKDRKRDYEEELKREKERKQQEQAQRQRERELEAEAKQREREGEQMRRDRGEGDRDYGDRRGERREKGEDADLSRGAPPQRSNAYRPPTMRRGLDDDRDRNRPPADDRRSERQDRGEAPWRPPVGESGWRQRDKERDSKWLPPSLRAQREQSPDRHGDEEDDTDRPRGGRDNREDADRPRTYREDGERERMMRSPRDEGDRERPRVGGRDDPDRERLRGPPRDEDRRGGRDEQPERQRGPPRDEERQGGGGWRGGASGGYSHRDDRDGGRDRDREKGSYGGTRGGDDRRRDDYAPSQRRDQPRDYPSQRRDEPRDDYRRDRPPRDQPPRDRDYQPRRDDRGDRDRERRLAPADDRWGGATGGGSYSGAGRDTQYGERDDRERAPASAPPRRIDYLSRPDREREDRRRAAPRGSSPPHPAEAGGDEDEEGGWQKVSHR